MQRLHRGNMRHRRAGRGDGDSSVDQHDVKLRRCHEEMSALMLDDIVAELHVRHGEEAAHIMPDDRVSS